MDDAFYRVGGQWEIVKDPDAVVDYTFDWSDWLTTDTITGATITIADSATMAKDSQAIVNSDQSVRVWISGGAARDRAAVSCLITTAAGRTDERTFYIRVRDR